MKFQYVSENEGLMMQVRVVILSCLFTFLSAGLATAHFGMLIPDTDELTQNTYCQFAPVLLSSFEMEGMELGKTC